MRNIVMFYIPDYSEICRFKNEFEKFEEDISLLRGTIFEWLNQKDEEEIKDLEIKITVEIEEISKFNLSIGIIPLITFLLGIMGKMYEAIGGLYFFAFLVLIQCIIIALGVKNSIKYHKYYIFLNDMIKRYNSDKTDQTS